MFDIVLVLNSKYKYKKYMLSFLEDRLELRPKTIFKVRKFKILISLIFARARNFNGLFLVNDASFRMSWERVSSFLIGIESKDAIFLIFSRLGYLLFISKIDFISIAKGCGSIGDGIEFVVIESLFAAVIMIEDTVKDWF